MPPSVLDGHQRRTMTMLHPPDLLERTPVFGRPMASSSRSSSVCSAASNSVGVRQAGAPGRATQRQRAPGTALPADEPLQPGNRERTVRVGQHRQGSHQAPLRKARRPPPRRGRRARPRTRPARPFTSRILTPDDAVVEADLLGDHAVEHLDRGRAGELHAPARAGRERATRRSSNAAPVCIPPPFHCPTT